MRRYWTKPDLCSRREILMISESFGRFAPGEPHSGMGLSPVNPMLGVGRYSIQRLRRSIRMQTACRMLGNGDSIRTMIYLG